jgi:hypothetical protein
MRFNESAMNAVLGGFERANRLEDSDGVSARGEKMNLSFDFIRGLSVVRNQALQLFSTALLVSLTVSSVAIAADKTQLYSDVGSTSPFKIDRQVECSDSYGDEYKMKEIFSGRCLLMQWNGRHFGYEIHVMGSSGVTDMNACQAAVTSISQDVRRELLRLNVPEDSVRIALRGFTFSGGSNQSTHFVCDIEAFSDLQGLRFKRRLQSRTEASLRTADSCAQFANSKSAQAPGVFGVSGKYRGHTLEGGSEDCLLSGFQIGLDTKTADGKLKKFGSESGF